MPKKTSKLYSAKDDNGSLLYQVIIDWGAAQSEYTDDVSIVDDIAMTKKNSHLEVI